MIFLPQILLLFFFIGLLEDTGYMARVAFIMDRLMGLVGLNGRAFIPLQSFFVTGFLGNPLFDECPGRSQEVTGTGPGLFDRGECLLQFQFTCGSGKAGQEANPDDLDKKSKGEESRE